MVFQQLVEAVQPMLSSGWPVLSDTTYYAIIAVNLGSFVLAYILLRLIWVPPTAEQLKQSKELEAKINQLQKQYSAVEVADSKECLEGDAAGDYSEEWTKTFDLTFVIIMVSLFVILCGWTAVSHPELFSNTLFWFEQIPKVLVMMAVSFLGGLLCRYFCQVDERGYIITNRQSAFKVNYTRKLQHFAAYLVPLVMHTKAAESIRGPLTLAWGSWFTMLGFLILIKPIRERFTFIMLQFNALDRPEDRPHCLNWIVAGNILPGALMLIFFRWLYQSTGLSPDLSYIFLFITGVGDGLAEPVGIYFGKHKYWTASLFGDRKYQRSFEGSACVFISSLIFTSLFWYNFHTEVQFWLAMLVLPPLMTYSEATSPHTIDTPFLMGLGGLSIFLISHLVIMWA